MADIDDARGDPHCASRVARAMSPRACLLVFFILAVLPDARAQLAADDADPVAPPVTDVGSPPADGVGSPAGDGTTGADGGTGGAGDVATDGSSASGGVGLGLAASTGASYDNLAADVAERLALSGSGSGVNNGTFDPLDPDAPNPYAFLYGVDESAALVNKRLLCKRGCVDPTVDVNLVWCAAAVTYSYCNRVISDDPRVAVLDMEEGAIAAYMQLVRRVPTPDAAECKPILRKWMCYEFFNRCNTDGTEFYPVCATTCQAAKYACGSPDWIDCEQEVEELENSAPDEWYENADRTKPYIRGVKPDGSLGNPVFETDQLRCTGGADGRRGVAFAALAASVATIVVVGGGEGGDGRTEKKPSAIEPKRTRGRRRAKGQGCEGTRGRRGTDRWGGARTGTVPPRRSEGLGGVWTGTVPPRSSSSSSRNVS